MSLDMRYLTNGKKEIFTVRDRLHMTFNIYDKRDDVPEDVRHYVPEKAQFAGPDLARILGVIDILYPNFPVCHLKDYEGENCIAESCKYADEAGGYTNCPYFEKAYINKALEE